MRIPNPESSEYSCANRAPIAPISACPCDTETPGLSRPMTPSKLTPERYEARTADPASQKSTRRDGERHPDRESLLEGFRQRCRIGTEVPAPKIFAHNSHVSRAWLAVFGEQQAPPRGPARSTENISGVTSAAFTIDGSPAPVNVRL